MQRVSPGLGRNLRGDHVQIGLPGHENQTEVYFQHPVDTPNNGNTRRDPTPYPVLAALESETGQKTLP